MWQSALVWRLLKVLIVVGIVLVCVFKFWGGRPYFLTFLFYTTAATWLVYVDRDVAVVVRWCYWMWVLYSGCRVILLRLLVTWDRFCELNLWRWVLIGLRGREIFWTSLVYYFICLGYFLPYPFCLLKIAHHLTNVKSKYLPALTTHLHSRDHHSQPVVCSFAWSQHLYLSQFSACWSQLNRCSHHQVMSHWA